MKLGVNIDHVASVRQVRGTDYPDPAAAAKLCAAGGAHSITVHLREDRRHIQDRDVRALRAEHVLPLNLEMGNAPEILKVALEVRPEEACLVPERRAELTTEGGLDAAGLASSLRPTVDALRGAGITVSLFIEPDARQVEASAKLGVPFVELHTGTYCEARGDAAHRELDRLVDAARRAYGLGLKVNAGHGINLDNVAGILEIPHLDTLNIGHSIVARALFVGMEEAVREMLAAMAGYRGGRG
ncbi:MAG TPA: pyridoxine 5'-phosphate synthase, partial [Kiritimatiellia bacterium]|jgi:pyridoxine 5-phosphate synthase